MTSKLVLATVVACALFTSPSAMAAGGPYILGVNLTFLSVRPTGDVVLSRASTDEKGQVSLTGLAPGHYEIVIDGPTFVAAIDKLTPPPAKQSSGPSVSIGGFFGGSSRSSQGHEGAERSSHSSSGGMGLGLSVPLGGHGDDPPPPGNPITNITVTLPADPDAIVSVEVPYCRDAAGQGMRIGFTLPAGASSVLVAGSFGYKWASNK